MSDVVKKEAGYIAAGTVLLSALVQIVWAVFFDYDLSVFFGGLWGGAVAILNFILMGLTVQKVANEPDQLSAKRRMQASYQLRMMLTIFTTVLAIIIPGINWIMAAISLFFPRLTILVMPLFRPDLRKKGGNG
ncbi:MAG: ATP synthase subunit I [Clostridia bacterium]|nr:ATP synthase subunit I [Clostridia bacterium]